MAVFTLNKELPSNSQVFNFFNTGTLAIVDGAAKPKSLTIEDHVGNKIIYTGTGFTYGDDGATGGTVTKIRFIDYLGDEVMTVTDAKVNLADLSLNDTEGNFSFFEKGSKTFNGSGGDDRIVFKDGLGNDTVNGLGGADYIEASAGKNVYDGGKGMDWLTYLPIFNGNGIAVDVSKGEVVNPYGKIDKIDRIEKITGTSFNDTFVGGDKADQFETMGGIDTATGGKGADTFIFGYGSGADTFKDFGNGADMIYLTNTTASFDEVLEKAVQAGKNVEIDFGFGDKIILQKFNLGNLSEEQFDGVFFG